MRFDVVIAGGAIMGAATAFFLRHQHGRSVTVLLNARDEDPATARAALELQHATDLQIAAQKETIAAAAAGSADARGAPASRPAYSSIVTRGSLAGASGAARGS